MATKYQIQYLTYEGVPAVYTIQANSKQDAMQRFQTRIIDWSEILDISLEDCIENKDDLQRAN